MIISFANEYLKLFFEKGGTKKKIKRGHLERISLLLSRLNAAKHLRDMNFPGSDLHLLKKPPLRGVYSIKVRGNSHIVFRFESGDAYDVDYDYLDAH